APLLVELIIVPLNQSNSCRSEGHLNLVREPGATSGILTRDLPMSCSRQPDPPGRTPARRQALASRPLDPPLAPLFRHHLVQLRAMVARRRAVRPPAGLPG